MLSLLFLPTAPKLPLTLHPSSDCFFPSIFYRIACFLLFFPIYSATVCSTETPLTRLTSDKVTLNFHLTRSASDTGKHILILHHVLNTVNASSVSKPATESRLVNIQEVCEPRGGSVASKLANGTSLGLFFFQKSCLPAYYL